MVLIQLLTFSIGDTSAQVAPAYPTKPVRVVTGEPGGGSGLIARLLAQGLTDDLGRQVIVDNRTSGVVQGEIVARAQPDGYTLLLAGGTFTIGSLIQTMPFDPVKDFSPVTLVASSPNVLVVHPSVSASSVKELIALAKSAPGTLNYASGPSGSSNHLAAELLKAMTNVDIVRITYKGTGPGLIDLVSGRVQLMFPNAAAVVPQIKSGKLRALAVTSLQPSTLVAGLPTMAASGLPGYESVANYGMFGPAKVPAAIVNRLHRAAAQFLNRPEVKERFMNAGVEAAGDSPDDLAAKVKSEMATMGKLIKATGIRSD